MYSRSSLLLAFFCCAASATAGPPASRHALVSVTGPSSRTLPRLLEERVTVVQDMGQYLLAVADDDGLRTIERSGLTYRILDATTRDKSYFLVYARTRAVPLDYGARVRVLKRGARHDVIEADPSDAETLSAAGFDIVQVFFRPIRPPRRFPPRIGKVPAQPDTLVQKMVASVSGLSIDAYVQRLQDFETRWAPHDSCQAAADYIKAQFESFGIDSVFFHHFSDLFKDNVVAVMPGAADPGKIIVIGGHYDSVSGNPYLCPGADDNASGTACVLECARILSGYEFDFTLVFIAFGAEEQGLQGSEAYAGEAAARGDDILAMVNVDMIGYLLEGDTLNLDIIKNSSSLWLRDRVVDVAALYVPGLALVDGFPPYGAGSDHVSFWSQGYDAIMFFEDSFDYSPWMHTTSDVVGTSYNCPALAEGAVKVALALTADLAGPRPESSVTIREMVPGTATIALAQNTPNPFNPRTLIEFAVDPPGHAVSLKIYGVSGSEVRVLIRREILVGPQKVWWDGTDDTGRDLPSAVYFCRLESDTGESLTRKLVLVR